MTPSTEAKLRKISNQRNWNEIQYLTVKDFLCNLAKLEVEIIKENAMKKVKQAA